MAVKTITIDIEAYDLLARHKQPGESFSRVIKAHFRGPRLGRDLLAAIDEMEIADEVLAQVERQVRARRGSAARAPKL